MPRDQENEAGLSPAADLVCGKNPRSCSSPGQFETWAAADLGTNTFRLLVAREVAPGRLREHSLLQETVRLGEGIGAGKRGVAEAALRRAGGCLDRFAAHLDALGVARRVGALTAVGRDADDGTFLRHAAERLGAELFVPTGEEEARLSFRGAVSLLPKALGAGALLFLDIGGGSSEAASFTEGKLDALSVPTGVVRLYEQWPLDDPPTPGQWEVLSQAAREAFSPAASRLDAPAWGRRFAQGEGLFVATAGTPLTLAAEFFTIPVSNTRELNGRRMSEADFRKIADRFRGMTKRERAALPSVAPGREDVILPGIALLGEFMKRFGARGFTVSDGGLLEGVLLQAVERERGGAFFETPGA